MRNDYTMSELEIISTLRNVIDLIEDGSDYPATMDFLGIRRRCDGIGVYILKFKNLFCLQGNIRRLWMVLSI